MIWSLTGNIISVADITSNKEATVYTYLKNTLCMIN